mmetsp:Transcript_25295/g.53429  ORF Transcript_25295/g.53429 Transcript_25295/m.53429 type:complete len:412 (+) Transcript_25295:132-1367(+)|eukprot:CAMPEP_0183738584 /NCGR_PEP_ID=MMETSP0737-20130205/54966_1 /TAXON_ID=385413 /ORGANISM="Thalassiosira miniscula, Strain CCMP1093" /LENGTH=411 /DNA_ID=CAMNT_0025973149 /DNA_START=70 /DNA_END=1305 /DNA_ORIENTATION=+
MCSSPTESGMMKQPAEDRKKQPPAATSKHGLSPTLIKAEPSYHASPIVAWALVILCTSSFYIGPLLLLLPFMLYPFYPQAASCLFATNLLLVFLPVAPYPPFRRYCQLFYKIFNFHHNVTPKLNEICKSEKRLSIVCVHPHAIIPLHGFIWSAICDQILPDVYGIGCTTDGALILPVLRHLLRYMNVGSTSKKALLHGLQNQNENLFILPGGVAEIFLSRRRSTHHDTTLSNTQTIKARRYGLMKLALQTGAVLYPSFVFGASDMLDQLTPSDPPPVVENEKDENNTKNNNANETTTSNNDKKGFSFGNTMQKLSRKIGGGLTLYYGQFGLPIPFTPQLSMVVGDPIYPVVEAGGSTMKNVTGDKVTCTRIENPTKEQVEELMERYVNAMYGLFEQYKEEAGYPNEKLQII